MQFTISFKAVIMVMFKPICSDSLPIFNPIANIVLPKCLENYRTILWVQYDAQIAVSDDTVLGKENSDEIAYAV